MARIPHHVADLPGTRTTQKESVTSFGSMAQSTFFPSSHFDVDNQWLYDVIGEPGWSVRMWTDFAKDEEVMRVCHVDGFVRQYNFDKFTLAEARNPVEPIVDVIREIVALHSQKFDLSPPKPVAKPQSLPIAGDFDISDFDRQQIAEARNRVMKQNEKFPRPEPEPPKPEQPKQPERPQRYITLEE